jgi:hypothetical protein
MQTETLFVVLAHRSAKSIFGAASNPVIRNGTLLCFTTEEKARFERDRLNASRGGSQVRYSVRPVHVELKLPSSFAGGEDAKPWLARPLSDSARDAAPRAA